MKKKVLNCEFSLVCFFIVYGYDGLPSHPRGVPIWHITYYRNKIYAGALMDTDAGFLYRIRVFVHPTSISVAWCSQDLLLRPVDEMPLVHYFDCPQYFACCDWVLSALPKNTTQWLLSIIILMWTKTQNTRSVGQKIAPNMTLVVFNRGQEIFHTVGHDILNFKSRIIRFFKSTDWWPWSIQWFRNS